MAQGYVGISVCVCVACGCVYGRERACVGDSVSVFVMRLELV